MGKIKDIGISAIIGFVLLVPITVSAQSTQIPEWVKGVANFWVEGNISDDEFGEAISFLIEQNIIQVKMANINDLELQNKIKQLEFENVKLQAENNDLKNKNLELQSKPNQNSKITVPTNISGNFKLYDLLPTESDLSSEWKVIKSIEYGKPTKNFYYEDAVQTKYNKNVNTIKEYRMNVFLFSNESIAKENYDKKAYVLKDNIGYFSGGKWHIFDEKQLVMDTGDCVGIFKHTDYTMEFEHVYGYCLVGEYIIYQDINGYYPEMHDDFVDMMSIAKQKVRMMT